MPKSKCIFCKGLYVDIIKHEDNCPKQFKVLIGPDYEKVKCKHCPREFYKVDKHYWDYFRDKLVYRTEYGIWKHLRAVHRITDNIEEHYETIVHVPEVDPEPAEKIESKSTKYIPKSKYEIDENGVVTNQSGRVIKSNQMANGTHYIELTVDYERIRKPVAYFVALAFIENPNNYQYVIHKDKDRLNNHFTNLEWSDKKEYLKL